MADGSWLRCIATNSPQLVGFACRFIRVHRHTATDITSTIYKCVGRSDSYVCGSSCVPVLPCMRYLCRSDRAIGGEPDSTAGRGGATFTVDPDHSERWQHLRDKGRATKNNINCVGVRSRDFPSDFETATSRFLFTRDSHIGLLVPYTKLV